MPRFEFLQEGEQHFCEITQDGAAVRVHSGKIGGKARTRTMTCASVQAATAEVARQAWKMTKLGHREVGPPMMKDLRLPPDYPADRHPGHVLDLPIRPWDAKRGLPAQACAVKIGTENGPRDLLTGLDQLLAAPGAERLQALVIGPWSDGGTDSHLEALTARLVAARDRLRGLRALFLGDVTREEQEVGWLPLGDLAPLLHALPGMEEFVVRGGQGLRFAGLRHARLDTLIVQAPLTPDCARDLAAAEMPMLARVSLRAGAGSPWLLSPERPEPALAPLFSDTVWPRLEYLAITQGTDGNSLARLIARSPILAQLRGLDLSDTHLGDHGAEALLANPALRRLTLLRLRDHLISDAVVARLKALGISSIDTLMASLRPVSEEVDAEESDEISE